MKPLSNEHVLASLHLYLWTHNIRTFSCSTASRDTTPGCHTMDTYIPSCALNRTAGTVIVRLKMDDHHCCDPTQDTGLLRYMSCEHCNRTRVLSKSSDCDSGLVGKSRPYRASTAKSRYVNVCAAVCLLLLVSGLSPQSTAAPHRTRKMDRQRRSSDSSQENSLWANPCDYNDSVSKSALKYSPKLAKDVASQARNAQKSSEKYKDTFALKVHSVQSFDTLLSLWSEYEWLRQFPWFKEEVLPKEKVLHKPMPDEYIKGLMANIDEVLPAMYKGLKMVVAGLNKVSTEGLNDNFADENLKNKIKLTMHDCRAVLCLFSDIMRSRNLEVMPLVDSEVPEMKTDERKMELSLLIYRDTINYLEYLAQVFQTLYETDVKGA